MDPQKNLEKSRFGLDFSVKVCYLYTMNNTTTDSINMTPDELAALRADSRWMLSGPGACAAITDLAVEVLGHERAHSALYHTGYLINTGWRPSSAHTQALIMAAYASGIDA
jgi:hypothetical protein